MERNQRCNSSRVIKLNRLLIVGSNNLVEKIESENRFVKEIIFVKELILTR